MSVLVGQSRDSFHVLLKCAKGAWWSDGEHALVFIMQCGRQPLAQEVGGGEMGHTVCVHLNQRREG